jgi:glutathione synthase/RimK-type ligase-like ATP-grasp enzyme
MMSHPKLNFVVIGNPENRRIEMFQAALTRFQQPPAKIISYLDLIKGEQHLSKVVQLNSIVRIESPGENFLLEKALLTIGACELDPLENTQNISFSRLSKKKAQTIDFYKGLILYPRQWYLGYLKAIQIIKNQLASCPKHKLMNNLDDIGIMFDKILCHKRLLDNNINVPFSLGNIFSFDDLQNKMKENRLNKVFIKLSNGSSASGVIAYQTNGNKHIAITSTKLVKENSNIKLYNSLKLNTYSTLKDIKELIDNLSKHCVHVEKWIPKAGFQDRIFDLRVLVIGQKAHQIVVRSSKSPITNLHLLNKRGDLEALKSKLESSMWEKAMVLCQNTMKVFEKSLYAGIDLMFAASFRSQYILEVNAFGDLLPNVLVNQLNSYECEILEVLKTYDQC